MTWPNITATKIAGEPMSPLCPLPSFSSTESRFHRVIIHNKAYDVTEFKEEHPGGKSSELCTPGTVQLIH